MRNADMAEPVKLRVRVRIAGSRFAPRTLAPTTGRTHDLVFRREETAPCSERVVFPSVGRSVTLPPFEDVGVELPALPPGVHAITCQRGVLYVWTCVPLMTTSAARRP